MILVDHKKITFIGNERINRSEITILKAACSYPHGCLSEFHGSVRVGALCLGKAVLMHDPVSFETFWRPSFVKDQCLFHTNILSTVTPLDRFVCASCLPVPRCSRTIWSNSVRVLSIPWAEEVPLPISKYRFI
jgi:hypothetical protein